MKTLRQYLDARFYDADAVRLRREGLSTPLETETWGTPCWIRRHLQTPTVMLHTEKYDRDNIIVHGETRVYCQELRELGGQFQRHPRPGWIFPKKHSGLLRFLDEVNT